MKLKLHERSECAVLYSAVEVLLSELCFCTALCNCTCHF